MSRTALHLGLAALLAVAGCAGVGPPGVDGTTVADGPVDGHESLTFDHADLGGPVVAGGLRYPTGSVERNRTVLVLATASAATRFDHARLRAASPEAASFVNGTAFDDHVLVAFQETPASSAPDYRVESVERRDGELLVRVDDSARGGTADVTVETVLVRVPWEGAPPSVTVVTEEGERVRSG